MAHNIHSMDAEQTPSHEGLEMENPPALADEDTDLLPPEKQIISPLHQLLTKVPLEEMLSILQSLPVSFTLSGKRHNFLLHRRNYQCTIWGVGILKYQATGRSARDALINALTLFFAGEVKKDIHEYRQS